MRLCTRPPLSALLTLFAQTPFCSFESNWHSLKPHYEGRVDNLLRNGYGKGTFRNTFFAYEGEWLDGKMHGSGRLTLGDSGAYEGEFRSGEITGTGLRRWPDGSTYSGEFLDGERHGQV